MGRGAGINSGVVGGSTPSSLTTLVLDGRVSAGPLTGKSSSGKPAAVPTELVGDAGTANADVDCVGIVGDVIIGGGGTVVIGASIGSPRAAAS
jgi:hypothetical protein